LRYQFLNGKLVLVDIACFAYYGAEAVYSGVEGFRSVESVDEDGEERRLEDVGEWDFACP
jgi:hypothetical protein